MNKDLLGAIEKIRKFDLPDFFWKPLMRAAVLGNLGKKTEANAAYQKLLQLKLDFPDRARFYLGCFLIEDEWVDRMLESLMKAGLKEV